MGQRTVRFGIGGDTLKRLIALGAASLAAIACDPTRPCTQERAAKGECALASYQGVGGTGATGTGFEAYGTVPSGGHISLDCTPHQVPGFADHDCLYSHVRTPEVVRCTLKLADRLGVVVGVPTPVSFMSEAGDISPVAVSPAYPASPDALGHAEGYLEVFGAPLPPDVEPLPGEVSAQVDFGCGLRTANPRDGYVTVIAWVRGEEDYADVNQTGPTTAASPSSTRGSPSSTGTTTASGRRASGGST